MSAEARLTDLDDVDRSDHDLRAWVAERIRRLQADARRSADTHLLKLDLPPGWGIDLYLKDESTHVTGSLKHRLARSLFMYGLVNGVLGPDTLVVEASSGSTAVSEAHFARMLDLPFIAVMPRGTSERKIALIEAEGGRCHFVDRAEQMCSESGRLAEQNGGVFLDQFTYAERATDWRGHNNIAQSIFDQMAAEPHPEPTWLVVGAGTGGTSATLGRFLRYHRLATGLCVADVENSAFFDGWVAGGGGATSRLDATEPPAATHQAATHQAATHQAATHHAAWADCSPPGSRIEGIGRPRVEPSFIPTIVDRMIRVPDEASVAGARYLSERLGRRVGASTGTNLVAVARLVTEMRERAQEGSIVTLLCDSGDRYTSTYFDDGWVADQGWVLERWTTELANALPLDRG